MGNFEFGTLLKKNTALWGHVMSMRCEQPLDELTIQVWLLYHPNFKYCTVHVGGTDNNLITRSLSEPFRVGA